MEKPITSRDRAHEALSAVRAYTQANHGALNKITELACEMSGENISRHTVGRWLREDPKGFQQPSLGNALLLFEALKKIQTEKQ